MKCSRMHKLFCLGCLAVVGGAILMLPSWSYVVKAAYSIIPLREELTVKDNFVSSQVTIKNTSEGMISIKVLPSEWTMTDKKPIDVPDNVKSGILENIIISPSEFKLGPQEKQVVRYGLRFPEAIPDGEYRIKLTFRQSMTPDFVQSVNKYNGDTNSTQIRVLPVPNFAYVGYLFKGELQSQPSVTLTRCSFAANQKSFLINAQVLNAGNKTARLQPRVIIEKQLNNNFEPFGILDLSKSTFVVLPKKNEPLDIAVPETSDYVYAAGKYRLELRLSDERKVNTTLTQQCEVSI